MLKHLMAGYYGNMDTITHTLAGAVIAKAIHDEKIGKWETIAGLAMGFSLTLILFWASSTINLISNIIVTLLIHSY